MIHRIRRTVFCAVLMGSTTLAAPMFAQETSVLRVGMTAADIPLTTGQANQGAEGVRFMAMSLYDGLVNWDLSKADMAEKLRPALATEWSVDNADQRKWTFKLREGVKFHDGSDFDADAVVWNFAKLMDTAAPQYDAAQAAQAAAQFAGIESVEAVDPMTVLITTKVPDATLLYNLSRIFMSSPARWDEVGGDWSAFANKPSGTGPWILEVLRPRERAELVRNANYWDPVRVPKSDRLVLLPMPDANTRTAALLSGQVDFIEAPSPDAVPRLEQAGMQIVTNVYPHVWPHQLNVAEGAPFSDIRVRKAANLAIDREGMAEFLGGLAVPAKGQVDPNHPWFGTPTFDITYDPDAAAALMEEAGYTPDNPLHIKLLISTAGSGQMQPLPMNEYLQENLEEVGFEVELEVFEWEALRERRRKGAFAPENAGADGLNNSWAYWDPNIALLQTFVTGQEPPVGTNWGSFSDPEIDALAEKAKVAFDPEEMDEILAQMHSKVVDQAAWLWVVHDLNPRALAPNVKGFVQAQSWFQDLTPVYVEN